MNAHDMFRNAGDESLAALFAQVMDLVGLPGDKPLTNDELHAGMQRIWPATSNCVSHAADSPAVVDRGNPEPQHTGLVEAAHRAGGPLGASQLWCVH